MINWLQLIDSYFYNIDYINIQLSLDQYWLKFESNMSRPKKFYKKLDFSDKEIEDEIKDEIRDIREQNLKEV